MCRKTVNVHAYFFNFQDGHDSTVAAPHIIEMVF